MTLLEPVAAYDRIAPQFARLAEQRRAYLDAIDRRIISETPSGSRALLDIGAGNGSRSRRIAQAGKITELVLLEPSVRMQPTGLLSPPDTRILSLRAEELGSVRGEFDVITCLWNVLGHIFPQASRIEVLRQSARLLSPRGRMFLDVSHRYNARHYGVLPSVKRFFRDCISPGETAGDVVVAWDVGGALCSTRGHVFTHSEVQLLCRAAGLSIEKKLVVDYATGELCSWSWEGHLLYELQQRA